MKALIPKAAQPLEIVVPTNAAAKTPNIGNSFSFGVYAQIHAGLGYDYVIHDVVIDYIFAIPSDTAAFSVTFQWQLAKGAAASEVPIANGLRSFFVLNAADAGQPNALGGTTEHLFIEPVLVPAGTRLAIQVGVDHATNDIIQAGIYLVGYDAADYPAVAQFRKDNYDRTARYMRGGSGQTLGYNMQPLSAEVAVVTGGSYTPSNGSWTQIIASLPYDVLIMGFNNRTDDVWQDAQLELGIGAAASEIAVARTGMPTRIGFGNTSGYHQFIRPVFARKGDRISVRAGTRSATKDLGITLIGEDIL